ncbi:hypothetical protein EON63_20125 [archaeon]|nr:MAG: hypothetical protein EON63_20125 [archaeon]
MSILLLLLAISVLPSHSPPYPETQEIHNRATFQFGKTSHTKYSLDFKYPLSPIQVCLVVLCELHGLGWAG